MTERLTLSGEAHARGPADGATADWQAGGCGGWLHFCWEVLPRLSAESQACCRPVQVGIHQPFAVTQA